jgi:hypothetical protein
MLMSTALYNSYEMILAYICLLLNFVLLLVVKKKLVVAVNQVLMLGKPT